jgi:serine/threonine protein kinase
VIGHEQLAGRYELRGPLGCGGMAEVHDGWDTRLNRAVAIKLLHASLQAQPDIRRRFESEARAAASLSHPNIVAVYDYGDHAGSPFIVMERLPGQTLADVIELQGPMHPELVRSMLNDVLAALTAAHAAGVLHRDIKPANILVSSTGDSMKVADFGIAKTGGSARTTTGQIIGTIAYMSPERVSGTPASVSDDLYAVGLMGYEALAGHRAFPHENPAALARAIMDEPPPSIASVRPDVEPAVAGAIDRAMAREPHHRFPQAAAMRAALNGGTVPPMLRPPTRVLDEPLPPSATYALPPPPRRRMNSTTRNALVGTGVVAALAVSALAFVMDPSSPAPAAEPVSTSTPVAPPPPPPVPPLTPVSAVAPPQPEPVIVNPEPGRGNNKGNQGKGQGKKGD